MSTGGKRGPEKAAERLARLLQRERDLWEGGLCRIAGVDEAGVGPLAGPVVAAAVIFPVGLGLEGVNDSKQLTPARRRALAEAIRQAAASYCVARVDPEEIDRLNIYQAGLLAMRRAVEGLVPPPEHLLVDGRSIPGLELPQERWIKGDTRCHAIAAASILAKTERDDMMVGFDAEYPGYDFASHKGYATRSHRDALRRLGPSPIHRRSFTLLPPRGLFD